MMMMTFCMCGCLVKSTLLNRRLRPVSTLCVLILCSMCCRLFTNLQSQVSRERCPEPGVQREVSRETCPEKGVPGERGKWHGHLCRHRCRSRFGEEAQGECHCIEPENSQGNLIGTFGHSCGHSTACCYTSLTTLVLLTPWPSRIPQERHKSTAGAY